MSSVKRNKKIENNGQSASGAIKENKAESAAKVKSKKRTRTENYENEEILAITPTQSSTKKKRSDTSHPHAKVLEPVKSPSKRNVMTSGTASMVPTGAMPTVGVSEVPAEKQAYLRKNSGVNLGTLPFAESITPVKPLPKIATPRIATPRELEAEIAAVDRSPGGKDAKKWALWEKDLFDGLQESVDMTATRRHLALQEPVLAVLKVIRDAAEMVRRKKPIQVSVKGEREKLATLISDVPEGERRLVLTRDVIKLIKDLVAWKMVLSPLDVFKAARDAVNKLEAYREYLLGEVSSGEAVGLKYKARAKMTRVKGAI